MGFYGLEIAKTGLYASQTALEVIGQNVANSATQGYSRQRVETASIEPASRVGRLGGLYKNAVGGGVEITSIRQVRDAYIDRQIRKEYASSGKWSTKADATSYIESLFNETSDYSISKVMANFFDSLSELSTDPSSNEIRTTVQQNGLEMTNLFNSYYQQLSDLQDEQNENMFATVQEINDTLTNIADYDAQIYSYELTGSNANDLRDKRNLMLDKLSQLINIDYYENNDGELVVTCEGHELINHTDVTKLTAVANQTGEVSKNPGYYSIYYEGTTNEFQYSNGKLEGYREMRDGNSVDSVGIPRLMDNLNKLCQKIAEDFNTIHEKGFTLATATTTSTDGVDFFDVPSNDYDNITAGNFTISSQILADVNNIAASSKLVNLSAPNTNEGNNENILDLVALCGSDTIAGTGDFEDQFSSILTELAINSSTNNNMNESQGSIISNLENRRDAVSGVSINDEMVDMVKYQHAYNASSRMITAIDEMLDTLINNTGVVGR